MQQPVFLSGLNPEQLEAVTIPSQSALILAGAGSGKTRVLTTRIAWLISTGQATPASILAVTFTNKAAKEMHARVAAMLPINMRGMWIGTFHGLCNRMLRAHFREAGLPQVFQILDTQDQQAAIKRLMKAMKVNDEKFPPRQVQWFINAAKEAGKRAREVDAYDDYARRMTEIFAAYDEQCNREGVVDFPELLLRCFELLQRNEILRDHYRARFKHILVDEFQDTNVLQYRWLKLLAGDGASAPKGFALAAPGAAAQIEADCSIFAVGDDDQSIYAFRGANVANMQHFERDFHVERIIKLEQNYRSHGNILEAANAVIANNRRRLGKNLWTSEGKGEPIRVFEATSDLEEASFVVDEVKALIAEGVQRDEIALLYRSNAQSRVLEHALFSAGIPYRVYGGLRFFERQEIKHALAYLRLVGNPDDDNAFLRVVNFPTRGIGNRTLEQLQDAAKAAGSTLWAAAKAKADSGKRKPDAGEFGAPVVTTRGVEGFVALIERLRQGCEGLGLGETVEHVVEKCGLNAHYKAEREGTDRLENLGELVNAATLFANDPGNEDPSLTAFLTHAALEAGDHQAQAGVQALQLMTVHSAKGLEFHTVFIGGMEEGLFPHENSLTEADGLDEERRLMYVAITRARRRLYVTYAQSRMLHGQTRYNIRSRFLLELPPLLLKAVGGSAARGEGARTASSSFGSGTRGARGETGFDLAPASPWRVGQSVVHPKFGRGVIIGAEGRGADARVQVNFQSEGMKWLALEYAKLTAA